MLQVHFHRPSEHLIGGRIFRWEAHFVHRADTGALAVVRGDGGKPNRTFNKIIATMPAGGTAVKAAAGTIRRTLPAGKAIIAIRVR